MNTLNTRSTSSLGIACMIALEGLFGTVSIHAQNRKDSKFATTNATDAAECMMKLTKIFEAIQVYQEKMNQLPDWLSDLHPKHLNNPKDFICPFVEDQEDFESWRQGVRSEVFWDPVLPISYGYEFCKKEYELWSGWKSTVQEYKLGQMKVLGDKVPIIRCLAHRPYLNLSVGGSFFESPFEWEDHFNGMTNLSLLYPKTVFSIPKYTPIAGRPAGVIAPRDPMATPRQVDLGHYYHVGLEVPWAFRNPIGEDMGNLPGGIHSFAKGSTPYDIRGIIQLAGAYLHAPYPVRVDGITINQRFNRLHILMGTYFPTRNQEEKVIARIELVSANEGNKPVSFSVVYGRDILEWRFSPELPSPPLPVPIWIGRNGATEKHGYHIRLFNVIRENPKPMDLVHSINFISTQSASAPFLVALTLE